jgi:hypothetical protein
MGINLNKYTSGRYFSAAQLPTPLILTILAVAEAVIGHDKNKAEKIVLAFNEDPRALPLNKTRTLSMKRFFGDDTDHWVGQRIRIRRVPSTFGSSPFSIVIEAVPGLSNPVRGSASSVDGDELPAPDSPDWEVLDDAE